MPQFYCHIALYDNSESEDVWNRFFVCRYASPNECIEQLKKLLICEINNNSNYNVHALLPSASCQDVDDGDRTFTTVDVWQRPVTYRSWKPDTTEWHALVSDEVRAVLAE